MNRTAHAALAVGLLGLAGCASDGSDRDQFFQIVRQSVLSFHDSGITLKQAAAIPYASMGWRLDGGSQNIIILATDNGQEQLWTSAAHVVLLTEHGRVKHTVGLPRNMGGLAPHGSGAMIAPAQALKASYLQRLTADFPDIGRFGIPIDCRGTARGAQLVTILGKKISTVRVVERCEARTMRWNFTNTYWVDRDNGLVWRSEQHIHPHGDVLETEVFRPPG